LPVGKADNGLSASVISTTHSFGSLLLFLLCYTTDYGTYHIYDKRKTPDILENVDKLTSFGAIYIEDYENLDFDIDVLVVSPGVPIDSEICKYFKLKGVRIIGEIELACLDINKPIVAITGTNGKTTVSTLIDNALNVSGVKSILCGNVGTPVSS
jgi:UDP-N-acetylmuramoylalanine--D-glutamate ligase